MLRLVPVIASVALTLPLAGCFETFGGPGSVIKGECQLVHTPAYAVYGKTRYDQTWIDRTTEAVVVGCKQPRPKARPPSLDAPKAAPAAAPVPKPRPKFLDRLRGWLPKRAQ